MSHMHVTRDVSVTMRIGRARTFRRGGAVRLGRLVYFPAYLTPFSQSTVTRDVTRF
nr:MAG TPA: hypothetical protein [Caudoviricetes sp.]